MTIGGSRRMSPYVKMLFNRLCVVCMLFVRCLCVVCVLFVYFDMNVCGRHAEQ